jgi:transcriptional regulator with GAF, ATPase, and Fis domain
MPEISVTGSDRKLVFADASPLEKIIKDIEIFAPTNKNILITGASGTGKETIARLIHQGSSRKDQVFHAINCGGLSESLLESTLFGHEKGAFTGATHQKIGAFEAANGGTLFLDEIGEMSPAMQTRLLRVLQEGEVQRVGSNETTKVTPRIIAATNLDVEKALAEGKLRKDLYYRLRGTEIHVPDLEARKMDIPFLAEYFAEKTTNEYGWKKSRFAPETLEVLTAHHWPGNVRELQNMVEEAVIRANHANTAITPDLLIWPEGKSATVAFGPGATTDLGAIVTRNGTVPLSKIAEGSGINRNTVRKFLDPNHRPDTAEALALYIQERDGDAEPFWAALLKRTAKSKRTSQQASDSSPPR